jgi:flagellar hook-associated protein 2
LVDSITKTLGAGSGIDVTSLVSSLVEAQYSVKTKQNDKKAETLTAQVSTLSSLKSGMTSFASALASLVKGGSLATAAISSNAGIVKASTIPGKQITAALNSTVEVRALAAAQVAATNTSLPAGTTVGTGSVKIQFGSVDPNGDFQADAADIPAIDITDADKTLTGIAAKINAATPPTGLVASIITDAGGERLVLKGASGAARAFTVTATDGDTPGLAAAVNVGTGATGTTIATSAADARVAVDGVEVRRATNSIDDLIPGVRLSLQSAAIGTKVSLGTSPPTSALTQAVNDVVSTYNELFNVLKEATDPANGKLARDSGALEMKRQLGRLTLTDLTGATGGSNTSLAQIGVTTNRDGTLSVDSARLSKALANDPAAVEAMFTDRGIGASGKGLSATLNAISASVTSVTSGLGASQSRYAKAQSTLAADKAKVIEDAEKTKTRMTQQYASMDARVAAYKSTQTFISQQVDAWNKN